MKLKRLIVYFEEPREGSRSAIILYGRYKRRDFAVYSINILPAPGEAANQSEYIVATGDDPYIQDVRAAIQTNGQKPISIVPRLLKVEIDVPNKLVRDVLLADQATDKVKYGSIAYRNAQKRLNEAAKKLFPELN